MGEPCTAVTHILVHTRRNIIVLLVDENSQSSPVPGEAETGVLDIGTRGALIGIELGQDYVSVSPDDGADDDLIRSVDIEVNVRRDENGYPQRIELPRSNASYEITFPIGNRCWRRVVDGKFVETCVTTITH